MLGRRAFLKAASFLALIFSYPKRALGQEKAAGGVTLSLSQLKSPWDNLSFTFGSEAIPGLAVRLPDGTLAVISRICPHQKCFTDLIKDPAQVFRETTFEPSGPVVACPCHGSVFDLQNGGKVLFGPAPRPPDRFEFRIEGERVIITRLNQFR